MTLQLFESIEKGAVISDCKQYRYQLWRIWDKSKPMVMFVMLNPSTADENTDDPTIRRCINFAKSWGYGGLFVCNLFAYRATNPKDLLKVFNPFGDENIYRTMELVEKSEKVVCAWGNEPVLKKLLKGFSPFSLIRFATSKLHFIEQSKDGTPKHPLYLKSNLIPKPYKNEQTQSRR